MPFEIQTNGSVPLNGKTAQLTFKDTLQTGLYAVGVSSFQLCYGLSAQHHLEECKILLNASPAGSNSNVLNVSASVTFQDKHTNTYDAKNSWIGVTAIAWTGSTSGSDLTISEPQTIQNGLQGAPVTLLYGGSTVQTALMGFDLQYAGDDHEVALVTAGVSGSINSGNPEQAVLTATAGMNDCTNHYANNPTATGFLFSSGSSTPGFVWTTYSAQSSNGATIDLGQNVTGAGVFLTSFKVQYPAGNNHYIRAMGAGPQSVSWSSSAPSKVSTSGVQAWMYDGTGHAQDNGLSSCNLLVVGTT